MVEMNMFARQNRDTDIRYKHMDFSFSLCAKKKEGGMNWDWHMYTTMCKIDHSENLLYI